MNRPRRPKLSPPSAITLVLAMIGVANGPNSAVAEDCRLLLVGQFPVTGLRVVVDDGATILVATDSTTKVLDARDLAHIHHASTIPMGGCIDLSENIVAIGKPQQTIVRLYDITLASSPVELVPFATAHPLTDLGMEAGYLYVAMQLGVAIVRVQPGSDPVLVSTYTKPGSTFDMPMAVDDGFLLAGYSGSGTGWDLVSIVDPTALAFMSKVYSGFPCNQPARPAISATMAVAGHFSSYCAVGAPSDITVPTKPVPLASIAGWGTAMSEYAIVKGLVAAPYDELGVGRFIGLFDPTTGPKAKLVHAIKMPQQPGRVASDGQRLYTLQGSNGLKVYNVDPCYANCECDSGLNIQDFVCFQTRFAIGDPQADCNGDSALTIDDFVCFQTLFAMGC